MKKFLLTLIGIILGLFVLLSLLDKSNYKIEKKIWKVQKEFYVISKDPKVVPAAKFEEVAKSYRKIAEKYPKSSLTPRIYLHIGMVYAVQKNFPKARAAFEEAIKRYPDNAPLVAEALFSIGLTHDQEKHPDQVLKVYDQIIKSYPLTKVGFKAPLYKANYLMRIQRTQEGQQALNEAVNFYKNIAQEHPKTPLEFISLRFLFTTYMAQKDWANVITTLERLLLNFSSPQYLDGRRAEILVKSINTISVSQLKDYKRPVGIYKKFIAQYPEHPLSGDLKKVISTLQKFEKEGVTLNPRSK
ncbi:MAG: tetratricopeptide repeat protein [Candidatus Omnitrophica bacterium]|nr:tetratricopeptide repeat protein [Candidatus Omnitrophota bacterium]